MNILEWMKTEQYVKKKMVSIYLSNYDGTQTSSGKTLQTHYDLPPAFIRFGDYNTTEIAKDNEIYFWTTTSKYNWTLDML